MKPDIVVRMDTAYRARLDFHPADSYFLPIQKPDRVDSRIGILTIDIWHRFGFVRHSTFRALEAFVGPHRGWGAQSIFRAESKNLRPAYPPLRWLGGEARGTA